MKLAISLHEIRGESTPIAAMVKPSATEAECMKACAVFGIPVWEIRDGQRIGNYIVRFEKAEDAG